MYVLLLGLGAVLAAAGAALMGAGLSVHDATVLTPGAIAGVGGLLVVGVALAVRALQRLERALRVLQAPTNVVDEPTLADGASQEPALLPIPQDSKIGTLPQPVLGANGAHSQESGEIPVDGLSEQFPTLVQIEGATVIEETDLSVLPMPERVAPASHDGTNGGAAAPTNWAPAATARRPVGDRRVAGPAKRHRQSLFDTLWPKTRPPRGTAPATAQAVAVAAAAPASDDELAPQPASVVVPQQPAPAPITVLKSGVVDGMAYTLYSDGSIEAQLPQGTLRFGSISALRRHIEQGLQH
jgi:hypothetical protein